MKVLILILGGLFWIQTVSAESDPNRWQQRAEYVMDIDFDVTNHQFSGTQKITYYNNSPDQLDKIFYHLYFNAFQPGSMMDVRSQTIDDPDRRVGDRISKLKPNEIGYLKVNKLTCDKKKAQYEVVGTILEVELKKPIMPGESVELYMEFDGQVPIQIRRSGRDNAEGISYSMAQWYPKLCEYDYQGWHANPYIGREFYGVWGDFDVTIHIDHKFMVAATGYLQNPELIGFGYGSQQGPVNRTGKTTWRFIAPNVHDFMWAADPDYTHLKRTRKDGTELHFFFQATDENRENWEKLPAIMDEAFAYINANFGQYPYKKYSFVHGGDGGMEYPMATLITGGRNLRGLVGVSVHELMHSWYQMVLGTNESLHSWMDEGFTSYASARVMNHLRSKGVMEGDVSDFLYTRTYTGYARLALSDNEEPLSTHADHYVLNGAYGTAAYGKGAVFLNQLEYIIGKEAFDRGLLTYFNTWKFKHPNPNDLIRVMEKESGLELDWYKEYFVYTTKYIDYSIGDVSASGTGTKVLLERKGLMPMPIDVAVTDKKGRTKIYQIPLGIMRGSKNREVKRKRDWEVMEDWPWTNSDYYLSLPIPPDEIEKIEIDPSKRLADVHPDDGVWPTVKSGT